MIMTLITGMKRDWKLMHRYIFHHIFLSDGTKAVVGIVCQPHTCSRLRSKSQKPSKT
jgi:hypothetical protein